ncbi:alpha/beta fold hydrolase [Roseateles asaccharophilus]|uniref:Alpha/beta hydrolase family esterase n=1 Tax=Roseateles asaccharophilus TaxID=582607 RepID=A0ABU2A729_9BURK|nr:alpha/beta fold hydrolase [Roseateles asaccharophilus]MDR7331818.1 putative alpha/beta hydrolase family esterase [Roseateles asaccharophilus]
MATKDVVFIQGGGKGAHAADAPLATSLKQSLGDGADVHFPRMRGEDDPSLQPWVRQIADEVAKRPGPVTLVGHSLGGAMLLRYLAAQTPPVSVDALVLLAAPAWDGKQWAFDELKLPDDLNDRLAAIPRLLLYHCRDDEVVPFAHLALHARRLPRAVSCAFERGGHQFDNDLREVAKDMQTQATRRNAQG